MYTIFAVIVSFSLSTSQAATFPTLEACRTYAKDHNVVSACYATTKKDLLQTLSQLRHKTPEHKTSIDVKGVVKGPEKVGIPSTTTTTFIESRSYMTAEDF